MFGTTFSSTRHAEIRWFEFDPPLGCCCPLCRLNDSILAKIEPPRPGEAHIGAVGTHFVNGLVMIGVGCSFEDSPRAVTTVIPPPTARAFARELLAAADRAEQLLTPVGVN